MTQNTYDRIDEEELLTEVEKIAGPRFRRLEERADGRDLMTWKGVLDHTDVDVSCENLTEMAERLVEERANWISFIAREDEDSGQGFILYYLEE